MLLCMGQLMDAPCLEPSVLPKMSFKLVSFFTFIDFDGRPYNTLTLSCERVISRKQLETLFGNNRKLLDSLLCGRLS